MVDGRQGGAVLRTFRLAEFLTFDARPNKRRAFN
jgi:hypothetical protein